MRHHVSALGRFALAGLFATVPRLTVSINVHGLEHDTRAPRTFYAITHKRDFDAFVPVPILIAHRGRRALTRDLHFAMRGDGFQMGFLARIVQRPAWFARALRPLNVGPILRGVGVHPLDSLHLRPTETWIREALRVDGETTIGELLAPATVETLATHIGKPTESLLARPASSLLAWRYFPVVAGGGGTRNLYVSGAQTSRATGAGDGEGATGRLCGVAATWWVTLYLARRPSHG